MRPTDPALTRHLADWLGSWPPDGPLEVVGSSKRDAPGWDGARHPVVGVLAPGAGVISVPPAHAAAAAALVDGRTVAEVLAVLPGAVARPGARTIDGVFRWSSSPADLPDAGTWLPADDRAVPPWLRPFGGSVLVELDGDGRYLAGVGLKRHDVHGWEIAVGTEPEARGRGLARRLVARAAREIVAAGRVATYLHATDNHASARVAEAAGFPDLGWRCVAVS